MYGLCQETHWDWIDLDDMNNLADTKGGNINAHIYSNLSAVAGAWMPCSSLSLWCGRPADAPPVGINPGMYLCLGIIHIQMHDNDSQINPWQEPLPPAVCRGGEGNLLLSRWPFPRQRPHFTANTLMSADTWVVFSFFSSLPLDCHAGNLWDSTQGTHVLPLSPSSPPESWIQPQKCLFLRPKCYKQ